MSKKKITKFQKLTFLSLLAAEVIGDRRPKFDNLDAVVSHVNEHFGTKACSGTNTLYNWLTELELRGSDLVRDGRKKNSPPPPEVRTIKYAALVTLVRECETRICSLEQKVRDQESVIVALLRIAPGTPGASPYVQPGEIFRYPPVPVTSTGDATSVRYRTTCDNPNASNVSKTNSDDGK